MKSTKNVVICPPCGEQSLAPEGFNPGVAVATKEGQNRKNALWPLLLRLTAVLPPQGREMFRGFTLIELLVVVLIIGILAAVAVPQYEVVVTKSRLTQALTMLKSIRDAQQVFMVANGYFAPTLEELDIALSGCSLDSATSTSEETTVANYYNCPNGIQLLLYTNSDHPLINLNTSYAFLFASHSTDTKHLAIESQLSKPSRLCQSNFSAGKKACQSFGGTEYTTKDNGNIVVYQLP